MPDFTSTVDIARPAGDQRDALSWARAVREDAPPPPRAFLRTGWLGLGLRARCPQTGCSAGRSLRPRRTGSSSKHRRR
ncbi:predicted protein [Streptomyces sp. AA4]|nr:predicted protein [Streptomyces sp. AA4]